MNDFTIAASTKSVLKTYHTLLSVVYYGLFRGNLPHSIHLNSTQTDVDIECGGFGAVIFFKFSLKPQYLSMIYSQCKLVVKVVSLKPVYSPLVTFSKGLVNGMARSRGATKKLMIEHKIAELTHRKIAKVALA